MKKWFCVLLTALLCLAGAAAAEEAPAEAFEHLWVSEADENDTVEIWFDGETWDVLAMRFAGEDVYSVLFDRVFYDEAQNALICEGGTLYRDSLAKEEEEEAEETEEETEEEETEEEETEEQETEEQETEEEETEEEPDPGEAIASGFGAALTVDENGLLHWAGSGDAWADRAYLNGDYEDDGLFTGEWECGDAWMNIDLRWGVYEVFVAVDVSENETHYWTYSCSLDETGKLTGTGGKTVAVFDEAAEEYVETVIYTDGEAAFTLDGDSLLWNDAKENAGEGMAFARVVEEAEETEEE